MESKILKDSILTYLKCRDGEIDFDRLIIEIHDYEYFKKKEEGEKGELEQRYINMFEELEYSISNMKRYDSRDHNTAPRIEYCDDLILYIERMRKVLFQRYRCNLDIHS